MWFWWFMLFSILLIPAVMIIGGILMWKRTPQKINSLFGYRTILSMKNYETWKFAHDYCGRLWWKIGAAIFIPSALGMALVYGNTEDMIGTVGMIIMLLQCFIIVLSIIPTEMALKRTFNKDGTRKVGE